MCTLYLSAIKARLSCIFFKNYMHVFRFTMVGALEVSVDILRYSHLLSFVSLFVLLVSIAITMDIP